MPVAELRHVGKRYGALVALNDVSLAFEPAEVHAVLGENGAGKSTLMKLLYGLAAPDSGEVRLGGSAVRLGSPADARRLGVAMVHQHFTLVPGLSAIENLALGMQGWIVRRRSIRRQLSKLTAELGFDLDPDRPVELCSVGERQRIEILKALATDPSLLILDEPTAVLGPSEVRDLLALVQRLRARGTAVVLVTHKLDEVEQVASRVSVLRRGALVTTVQGAEFFRAPDARRRLASLMVSPEPGAVGSVGQEAQTEATVEAEILLCARLGGEPDGIRRSLEPVRVLELEGVSLRLAEGGLDLEPLDLVLREGEILGVAGVEGNGQEALCLLLAGQRAPAKGRIRWRSGPWLARSRARRELRRRAGHVPADRQRDGVALELSVLENLVLRAVRRKDLRRGPWIVASRALTLARDLVSRLGIRVSALDAPARTLSGGNQQKLVLARELDAKPGFLVAAHPTRGLDVASTAAVWTELRSLAAAGTPVVLVSTDLDEVLALSHRVAVLRRGRLIEPPVGAGREAIGASMLGEAAR